ncbi:restriction endonuclease subunit S [Brachyspira aalborgi]|uniref:Restriction endonuclease subunit S n=1 Tax=Brachyspira aalborgi TaxID=29522 RepID=A0A5C8GG27_9SPIR|nr:restriction endonuclease subunit S [Brachyspira aalborgi]TXJ60746.1 restriction endonuclease subunit S [Brachyspira aalborgi]
MNKLPEDWEIKKLKDIGNVYTGITPPTSDKENFGNEHLFVTSADIKENKYIFNSIRKLSNKGFEKTKKFKKGDILYVCIGSIGKIALAKTDFSCNQQINVLRVNKEIDNEFVYYQLMNSFPYISKFISKRVVPIMNKTTFENLEISLPPLDEQKRIASALSKIDAYLENTIKLIEEKERFKRGIAKKLLTCKEGENIPEARFKGFEDEWMEVAISKIGTIITGNTPSTKNESFWNGNNVWVTPTDIKQKYISNSERKLTDDGLKKSRKLPANTLLITCIASIGKNAILKCEGACNQQINAIIPNKNYNVDFLYYLFENEKSYLKFKAPQSVIKIMSKSEFSKLVFKFPLLEEQEKIGGYLSLLDKEIDNLKKQKELIKEMKSGTMQKLLSGEVRLSKNAFNENI